MHISQISVLPDHSGLIIVAIPVGRLVIWHLRYYVDRIILILLTILPSESLLINSCSEGGRSEGDHEKKSERK